MKPPSISNYARARITFRLKQFLVEQRQAAESTQDTEVIHDLRVSIRRLQQALRTFRGLLAHTPAAKMRRRLRKLMALCARVRDCDVALAVLQQAGVATDDRIAKLRADRQDAEFALEVRLTDDHRWKRRKWLKRVQIEANKNAQLDLAQSIEYNLARNLPRQAGDLFAAGRLAGITRNPEDLHQFRLLAKRFRYTLELFKDHYGNEVNDILEQLRELQDYLGEINDCVTTLAMWSGDRNATMAIEHLLREREAIFKKYWRQYMTRREQTWKQLLARPRTVTV